MTRCLDLGIALLFSTVLLSACGGDSTAPPTTGTLKFNIVTTGVDIDSDGFLLSIDGRSPRAIPVNGTLSVETLPGTHAWTISGLSFNCDVTAPASADVTLSTTTTVDLVGSCTPFLRNAIIYTSEEFGFGEVTVMRPDGSRHERLTIDQAVYAGPVVSPDGQAIAVATRLGGSWGGIYLLDRFGKNRTKLVGLSDFDGAAAWSPDGTKIAFRSEVSSPAGPYGRIFVVNRDGTGAHQLTPESTDFTYDEGPSWSPDGTRLVFSRNGELSLINADGSGLVSTGVRGQYPAWSPDGTQIVYTSVTGDDGLLAMDMSFTVRRVTAAGQLDRMGRWSKDGQQIVFGRVDGSITQLYRVAADGSGLTKLSTVAKNESWPSWSPSF